VNGEKLFLILIAFCFILIVIGITFEAIVLGYSYLAADKVECNWIFCTFTTMRSNYTITEDCFQNGMRINCSEHTTLKEMLENATTLG
jgi:hypothetical protein